jgi:hypothetical protein
VKKETEKRRGEAYLVPRGRVFRFHILQGWQLDFNSGAVTSNGINIKTMYIWNYSCKIFY